jgi:hypothetical protein
LVAPTSGNEFKVVNWLRAAAIMAQIDPVAKGYLTVDSFGHFRLPALRQLGSIDLLNAIPSQTNLLAEYTLHNLSDADFTYSGPVVGTVEILLFPLARRGAGGSGRRTGAGARPPAMRPRLAAGASTGFLTVSSCNRDNASCPKPNGLRTSFHPAGTLKTGRSTRHYT